MRCQGFARTGWPLPISRWSAPTARSARRWAAPASPSRPSRKAKDAAIDFAYWVASGDVQRGPYAAAGGQPGHAAAWEDQAVNAATGNFYRDTRATLEGAWVRPRHDGYMAFQQAASDRINEGLVGQHDGAACGRRSQPAVPEEFCRRSEAWACRGKRDKSPRPAIAGKAYPSRQIRFGIPRQAACVARRRWRPQCSAWVAATQVDRPPPSVHTGQSLPQTTRSQPNAPIVCST